MNINCALNISPLYTGVQGRKEDIEKSPVNEEPLASAEASDVEKPSVGPALEMPEAIDGIEHYRYEEKPWEVDKRYAEKGASERDRKTLYVVTQQLEAGLQLLSIKRKFMDFSDHIAQQRPDIISTGFGFTLDENARIKILDPEQKLSKADKWWLTEKINGFDELRATAHTHSKTLMALVDHSDKFGGKYILNRYNFQNTIDYGNTLHTSCERLDEQFAKMLDTHLEKRPEQSKIDTHA